MERAELKKLREDAGLTQRELSLLTGLTIKQISAYESGNSIPKIDAAYRLAQALAVSTDRLIEAFGIGENNDCPQN